jgi:catechol 2,3-dioxygenase-like lactoylglutathione lyase family enzyme
VTVPTRAVGHVGISVPDLDAAIDWYGAVFGFDPIVTPHEIDITKGSLFVEMCIDIFGVDFKRVKVVHLGSANGTAIELFEFIEPRYERADDNFAYWRGGIFHFCVVAADIEEQVSVILEHGGRQRSQIRPLFAGRTYRACYCEDPWGTIIELTSHSHERMQSNQR